MKVIVDSARCNGHGECVIEAPDVFDLPDDSDVALVRDEFPDGARRAAVERAAAMCPVAAILIEG
ncbi:ferredoxin [Dactylosporangium sp. CA-092794]|uniref:ferredoxin n=1 Tax=Dactylosporangium sp. CA-092794 TaxID=3239929 RepID=UPI003D8B569D